MTLELRRTPTAGAVFALVAALAMHQAPSAQGGSDASRPAGELPLKLTANAIDMRGTGPAATFRLDITIERWSTPKEKKVLIDTLKEKGDGALLDAVQSIEPRAGFIRSPGSLGWDVYFAAMIPRASGGRRIVIATDRPMSFRELSRGTRSSEYEFLLAEIRLDAEGEGEGRLATAARVSYFEPTQTIEIENYHVEPVQLRSVRVVDGERKEG